MPTRRKGASPDGNESLVIQLWRRQPGAYFCVSTKSETGKWRDKFFKRDEFGRVDQFVDDNDDKDIYFCPHGFNKPERTKAAAVKPKLLYADLDKADPRKIEPRPTIALESSPNRYVGIWIIDEPMDEEINRRLTYAVDADKSGWDLTQVLRWPGTTNYKYETEPMTRILWQDGPEHKLRRIKKMLPRVAPPPAVARFHNLEAQALLLDPNAIRQRYASRLTTGTRIRLRQPKPITNFALITNGKTYPARRDDRSEIIFGIGCDFRAAGASPAETLAVVMNTCFWRERARDGKRENPDRLIGKIFAQQHPVDELDNALRSIDVSDWAGKPTPKRDWLLEPWIVMRKVTILFGDGGVGKGTFAQQLCVAVACDLPFLGMLPKPGRVYAFLAEDEEEDTHISMAAIADHYGVDFDQLQGQMRVAPRAGLENILMSFVNGKADLTKLFDELLAELRAFRPVLVVLDPAVEVFGGNENVRAEVSRFVRRCCGRIAREIGTAVLLLAHPSQAGMASGRGDGGSRDWGNASRSRLYLRRDADDKNNEDDVDVRILERMKANFAPTGAKIRLRWSEGVLVLDDHHVAKKGPTLEEKRIIDEVERAFDANEPYSAHPQGKDRWLGLWIMKTLGKSRPAASRLIYDMLFRKALVHIVMNSHDHLKGVCTPAQAQKYCERKSRDEAKRPVLRH